MLGYFRTCISHIPHLVPKSKFDAFLFFVKIQTRCTRLIPVIGLFSLTQDPTLRPIPRAIFRLPINNNIYKYIKYYLPQIENIYVHDYYRITGNLCEKYLDDYICVGS